MIQAVGFSSAGERSGDVADLILQIGLCFSGRKHVESDALSFEVPGSASHSRLAQSPGQNVPHHDASNDAVPY